MNLFLLFISGLLFILFFVSIVDFIAKRSIEKLFNVIFYTITLLQLYSYITISNNLFLNVVIGVFVLFYIVLIFFEKRSKEHLPLKPILYMLPFFVGFISFQYSLPVLYILVLIVCSTSLSVQMLQKISNTYFLNNTLKIKKSSLQEELLKEQKRIRKIEYEKIEASINEKINLQLPELSKILIPSENESHQTFKNILQETQQSILQLQAEMAIKSKKINTLHELITSFSTIFSTNNIKISIQIPDDIHIKNEESQNVLKSMLQECFQNIIKHAKTDLIICEFVKKESQSILKISDNGIGIDFNNFKKGFGILCIEQLAQTIQASFELKSNFPNGTTYQFEFKNDSL